MTTIAASEAGGRPPTIFEMSQRIYAVAAQHGIDPLTVDRLELWQIGGMLTAGESDEDRRHREDAEVFQARLDAHARGEEYEPDFEPFDPTKLSPLLRGGSVRVPPPRKPGVN